MAKDKILQVKNLTISFRTANGKVQAVRDVSFDVNRGETLAIVGESGSGKSVTSKAIIGISAVNAMHEAGEILYEGQDLLQISEDEFHKLRGAKISMVFQDPLSALNPIMHTGKQITEAILLNNDTDREDANTKLKDLYENLEKNMNEAYADSAEKQQAHAILAKFKDIQKKQMDLEIEYRKAQTHAAEALRLIRTAKANIQQRVHNKVKSLVKQLPKELKNAVNSRVVTAEDVDRYQKPLDDFFAKTHFANLYDELVVMEEEIAAKLAQEQPNFFRIAYEETESGKDYDRDFVEPFERYIEAAFINAEEKAQKARENAIKIIEANLPVFRERPLDEKKSRDAVQKVSDAVEKTINPLSTHNDSSLYTFRNTGHNYLDRYFEGIKKNEKERKRYARDKKKFQKLIDRGKTPGWQVIDADIMDLEWAQDTVTVLVERIEERIKQAHARDPEAEQAAHELIDRSGKLASRASNKISYPMARDHAINLMREVGIPEPELRFKQYPFELSGGMRQRIVIAIALCSDPNFQICDEPTTALDVTIQAQILELIRDLQKQRELSIIFITHDLGVVANIADRIAVMYAGKIVETGTADEVFYDPRHPYTWALLSSMPDLETKEELAAIPGTPPNMIYPPKGDAFAARNRYAMKIDFEKQPPMFPITETHSAATWLLHPDAPKVEPPAIVTERIERMQQREAEFEEETHESK